MNIQCLRTAWGVALLCLGLLSAQAQAPIPKPDLDPAAVALRCELHMARSPDTLQVHYFYLSDARRAVYETDGNPLGNVVQFSRQRVVVSRNNADGNVRNYVFDRMIGSLTMSSPGQVGGREGWSLSGECLRVDASRQKF